MGGVLTLAGDVCLVGGGFSVGRGILSRPPSRCGVAGAALDGYLLEWVGWVGHICSGMQG